MGGACGGVMEQSFWNLTVETIELSDAGAQATLGIAFDLMTPVGVLPWKIQKEWTAVEGEWMAEGRDTPGDAFATPARE